MSLPKDERATVWRYLLWLALLLLFAWLSDGPDIFVVIASWSVASWLWNQGRDRGEA